MVARLERYQVVTAQGVRSEEGAAVEGDAKRLHGSTVECLEGKRGR